MAYNRIISIDKVHFYGTDLTMSSQPPASSLINAPPPKSSDVDAGDVDAATFYRDENKLDVGGARARGPKMTLTQLENLKKSQGNRDLDIGGARGEGIKLDLTEEEDDDAGDGAVRDLGHFMFQLPWQSLNG